MKLFWFCFVFLLAFLLYFIVLFIKYLRKIPTQPDLNQLCFSEEIIVKIQSEQFAKARQEVLGSELSGSFLPTSDEGNLDFYKRTFGMTEAKIKPSDNPKKPRLTNTLVYYHLWKVGNTNIRSLLLQYAYASMNDMKSYLAQNCNKQSCVHPNVQSFAVEAIRNRYLSSNKLTRFPFTFVRDPIQRFISALTEVEYRSQQLNQTERLPLINKLGSQQRIQEFIRMILFYGGNVNFYRDYEKHDILHIYPMIGTFLLSQKIELNRLRFYKFESFTEEWIRLSKEVGIPLLQEIYVNRKEKDWKRHNSSADVYQTTLAAKSFFSYASVDIHNRLVTISASLIVYYLGFSVFLFVYYL
jgi:hypothetical protein